MIGQFLILYAMSEVISEKDGREENGQTARSDQPAISYYFQDELGRFAEEDVIKGNLNTTFSLNSYVNCKEEHKCKMF